jgi:trans-2,3-dihydro-3-hydroxyanthranilate isomerase
MPAPPREYRFRQVDVFTDRVFGGNPLAVFTSGEGLAPDEMQAIAREMNLSETTFVLPATQPGCAARVRIFTPARELAFAGHPTLGTAFVLATEGRLPADRQALEEGVGPVPIELEGDPRAPRFVWMRHREPEFGAPVDDRRAIAAMVGLGEDDLLAGAPIERGSTGTPFLFVPLRDRDTVDRALLDVAAARRLGEAASLGVFVFAPDPDPRTARVYSRMFAPHTSGVPEDPATGSASGPLGAYLVRYGLVRGPQGLVPGAPETGPWAPETRPWAPETGPCALEVRILSEQGVRMGRPSAVHIVVRRSPPHMIRVGGEVVDVLEGTLRIP